MLGPGNYAKKSCMVRSKIVLLTLLSGDIEFVNLKKTRIILHEIFEFFF